MDEQQRAAFLMAQSVAAMIEALGMMADNQQRRIEDKSIAYDGDAFNGLINRYGLGHNAAVEWLLGR